MQDNTQMMTRIISPVRVKNNVFSADHIAKLIDQLANVPAAFEGMDVICALREVTEDVWLRQEAQNRLFQRWRKLGLMSFSKGKWRLEKGAWNLLQTAALKRREGRI